MFGAVIGDIVGSTFEAQNHRSIYFEFFRPDARFTDDTVCTAAVADILDKYTGAQFNAKNISDELRLWCCTHINRGFGSMFHQWILNGVNTPYNSFGNGALMRVSPVARFAYKNSLSETEALLLAKSVTEVTHSHPQALLAVEIYTQIIFNLLKNKPDNPKEYIQSVLSSHHYPQFLSVEDYRISIEFDLSSQTSLLIAVSSIMEADNFEDAVRNAVSIGGDSDTYAAITGAIAEAIWGCEQYLPEIRKYFRQYDMPIIEAIKTLY